MKLNLGSGSDIRPGWVNVDIVQIPGVEVVTDLDERWPWEDDSIDQVWASDIFEHLRDKMHVMEELWRVCRHGAFCEIETPNMVYNPAGWSDPTHRTCWHPENMEYFRPGHAWYYYSVAKFVTVEMEHTAFRLFWVLRAYKEHDEDLKAQHVDYETWRMAWEAPLGFSEGRDILPVQTSHIPPSQLRIRTQPRGEG